MESLAPRKFTTRNRIPVEIKILSEDDTEKVESFFRKAAEETAYLLLYKEKETSVHMGVIHEDSLIGSFQFRVSMPDHPYIKHIGEFSMSILQDFWNQGIGKELLRQGEEFASRLGVMRMEAKVARSNRRAVAFYQTNGYKIEGRREQGSFINGQFIDEYFIAKLLYS